MDDLVDPPITPPVFRVHTKAGTSSLPHLIPARQYFPVETPVCKSKTWGRGVKEFQASCDDEGDVRSPHSHSSVQHFAVLRLSEFSSPRSWSWKSNGYGLGMCSLALPLINSQSGALHRPSFKMVVGCTYCIPKALVSSLYTILLRDMQVSSLIRRATSMSPIFTSSMLSDQTTVYSAPRDSGKNLLVINVTPKTVISSALLHSVKKAICSPRMIVGKVERIVTMPDFSSFSSSV